MIREGLNRQALIQQKPGQFRQFNTVQHEKTLQELQNAALRTCYRLSMCQVVFTANVTIDTITKVTTVTITTVTTGIITTVTISTVTITTFTISTVLITTVTIMGYMVYIV